MTDDQWRGACLKKPCACRAAEVERLHAERGRAATVQMAEPELGWEEGEALALFRALNGRPPRSGDYYEGTGERRIIAALRSAYERGKAVAENDARAGESCFRQYARVAEARSRALRRVFGDEVVEDALRLPGYDGIIELLDRIGVKDK